MQAHGYGYGPSFQGLREAWRVGDAVYGRAVLPEALSESAEDYGRASCAAGCGAARAGARGRRGRRVSDGLVLLPFEWSEVTLVATGARELRVRASVERRGEGEALAQLQLADGSGRAVARVGGLRLREASEAQIREAARQRGAAPVPAGVASGGVERGRAGSARPLIVGGDGELAKRLGLDQVDSVAALVARLDEGGSATGADGVRPSGGAGRGRAILAATHAAPNVRWASCRGSWAKRA